MNKGIFAKYFKNLSYLYKVPVDSIYSEKSFFLTVLFLPIIYCNDACLCENKVPQMDKLHEIIKIKKQK